MEAFYVLLGLYVLSSQVFVIVSVFGGFSKAPTWLKATAGVGASLFILSFYGNL